MEQQDNLFSQKSIELFYTRKEYEIFKEKINLQIDDIEKSITLARDQLETRLNSMNEFREQLRDQAGLFYTRKEHEIYKEKVDLQLAGLEKFKVIAESKADRRMVWVAIALSVIAIIVELLLKLVFV